MFTRAKKDYYLRDGEDSSFGFASWLFSVVASFPWRKGYVEDGLVSQHWRASVSWSKWWVTFIQGFRACESLMFYARQFLYASSGSRYIHKKIVCTLCIWDFISTGSTCLRSWNTWLHNRESISMYSTWVIIITIFVNLRLSLVSN